MVVLFSHWPDGDTPAASLCVLELVIAPSGCLEGDPNIGIALVTPFPFFCVGLCVLACLLPLTSMDCRRQALILITVRYAPLH